MEEIPEVYTPMGTTAENVAKRFEVSRETQDEFAYASQTKAAEAWENGFSTGEVIVPTEVDHRGRPDREITVDQGHHGPRPGTTVEVLPSCAPPSTRRARSPRATPRR